MNKELIEYKKIEEESGIDLITLFKALKNGIWIYDTYGMEMFAGHFSKWTSIQLLSTVKYSICKYIILSQRLW